MRPPWSVNFPAPVRRRQSIHGARHAGEPIGYRVRYRQLARFPAANRFFIARQPPRQMQTGPAKLVPQCSESRPCHGEKMHHATNTPMNTASNTFPVVIYAASATEAESLAGTLCQPPRSSAKAQPSLRMVTW